MKMQNMTSKTENMGEQSEKCRPFRVCLNISGFWLKSRYSYRYLKPMVTTNQKSTIYIHTIKKKEFKHSIKDSHQIMRREPKRKGRKKDLPKKYKAINRVSVRTYISIITLNVN